MKLQQTKTASVQEIQTLISANTPASFFTQSEMERLSRPTGIRSLYVRYLAKSMLLEVLGKDFTYTDISIENSPEGAPVIEYRKAGITDRLRDLGITRVYLSLSHTRKMVGVFMIFE